MNGAEGGEAMMNQAGQEEGLTNGQALRLDLYFWLQALVMALIALILVFTFVGRVVGVDGSSMEPTLRDGDMVLLQSIGYQPRQHDVVVLTKPFGKVNGPIVKRIIAVGGQHVAIDYDAGTVTVDGEILEEPYLNEAMERPPEGSLRTITEVTVPEGSIFVMGDNRNHSDDSRNELLGVVDERYVLGRVIAVVLPLSDFGLLE